MALKNTYLNVVDKYFANKQYDRAIELLEKLHAKEPTASQVKMKLADAYFLYGRTAKAVKILEEVAEEYANRGFTTKARAVQRKIKRIDASASIDSNLYAEKEEPGQPLGVEEAELELERKSSLDSVFKTLDNLFSGLSREDFENIIPLFTRKIVKKGDAVVEEGMSATTLFIIIHGRVRVFTIYEGREVELAILGAGEFFGEVGVLTGNPRVASITALEACELIELDREDTLTLSERYPKFRHLLETTQERRANETIDALLSDEKED